MQKDYAFGGMMLIIMVSLMAFGLTAVHKARAGGMVDTEMVIVAQDDIDTPLAIKRYISVNDCRRDREWMFSLLQRVNAKPVWIVCAPEGT